MKKIAAIILALALSPAISCAAAEATTAARADSITATAAGGHIYVVSGEVLVAQGKNPAHRATNGEAIIPDTVVNTTANSSALLKFEDGQVVTMQANSSLHVQEYHYDAKQAENSNIALSMLKGGMRFITGLIGQQSKQAFKLVTPSATIGIRGTEFMVAMVDDSMYSQVLAGDIGVANVAGETIVGAGQFATVASPTALATLVSASAIPPGTFTELLSIPVNPSAIPATPAAPVAPTAPPAAVPAVSVPVTGAAGVGAGAAASVGGAGLVGGALIAGLVGGDSDSAASDSKAAELKKPIEPIPSGNLSAMAAANSRSGKGLTAKIGTLGYGAEFNLGFSDSFATRFGINAYTYTRNANSGTVNYDFKLQLKTASLLADWYPFEGSFRASGGLMYNNNKISLNALPSGGSYNINGVSYTNANVGSLQGTLTFNKAAPYLGIGWGNPVATDKGWGMLIDFGVMFQGQPKTNLTVTCGTAIVATPACTQLQADAAAENAKLENDLSNYKLWPVVSIGISYQW